MLAERRTDIWSDSTFSYYGTSAGPFAQEGLTTSNASRTGQEWANRIVDLLRIRSLSDDWDAEGAVAPRPELVDSVLELFQLLRTRFEFAPPSRLVPSLEGGIVIEWQFAPDYYLEAECKEPFRAEWMMETPGEPTMHWTENWGPYDETDQRAA